MENKTVPVKTAAPAPVKAAPVKSVQNQPLADFIVAEMQTKYSSPKELAERVVKHCAKIGKTHTSKNKPITVEHTAALASAILRDVKNKRHGHWATFKVEETKDGDKSYVRVYGGTW
jgi:hypothetical protein